MARLAFWTLAALTLAVYAVMLTWSLPHLEELSGFPPFDMRPFGYSYPEAQAEIAGLGADGKSFYLTRQHLLDLFYPGLLALVLIYAFRFFRASRILIMVAVLGALADYAENLAVRQMLLAGPELMSPRMVGVASALTIAKSVLNAAAQTALVLLLLRAFWRWIRASASRQSAGRP